VRGCHGANPGERDHEQDFVINVELTVDVITACGSDTLRDTVNYSTIHKTILRIVGETSYHLLEKLATSIIEEIFLDDRVERARVSIAKPNRLNGCTPEVILDRVNSDRRTV
jgi:D-erythro-7,8-dihydroneopterin triphosphate epimerase